MNYPDCLVTSKVMSSSTGTGDMQKVSQGRPQIQAPQVQFCSALQFVQLLPYADRSIKPGTPCHSLLALAILCLAGWSYIAYFPPSAIHCKAIQGPGDYHLKLGIKASACLYKGCRRDQTRFLTLHFERQHAGQMYRPASWH